ncbi:MAG: hypothetical protein KC421_19215 [Anaerolineales bacterium]|nr:hypothetical protein [Anaerolineales bacterium]
MDGFVWLGEYGRFLPLSHATTHEMDGFVWLVGNTAVSSPDHMPQHMKWMALFGGWGNTAVSSHITFYTT